MMQLLTLYRHHATRLLVVLTGLFIISSALMPLASVMFLKGLLSYIATGSDLMLLLVSGVTFLVTSFTVPMLTSKLDLTLSEYRLSVLCTNYFTSLLRLPLALTQDSTTRKIINNGELFLNQSWKGYQRLLKLLPTVVASVLALLLIALLNDTNTKLFMLLMVLLALVINYCNTQLPQLNQAIDTRAQQQKHYSGFYAHVLTDNKKLREVKSSSYEDFISDKLAQGVTSFAVDGQAQLNHYQKNLGVISLLTALPYVVGVLLIIFGLLTAHLTLVDAIFYLSIIKVIQDSISRLLKNGEKIKTDLRLYQLYVDFEKLVATQQETPKTKLTEAIQSLELVNLSFKYPQSDSYVLKDLNYRFEFPARVALVGESGSGKTTLVKLICGFLQPSSGKILVNGIDLAELDLASYHQQLATVFQKTDFFAFSFADNIMPSDGCSTITEVGDSDYRTKLTTLIQDLQLESLINKLPQGLASNYTKHMADDGVELSGGQLQMLLLLRSMLKPSSMVILDEATSAMDINNEVKTIREFLRATNDKMAVIVTHRLLITKFCDAILVLDQGRLVETGTHQQLLAAQGYYAQLYNLQNEGYEEVTTCNS